MRRHVVLVGLPGSGKTTAGRLAARMLGAPFADLDALVEARAGKSVARIFREDGERVFRFLEAAVGTERLTAPPAVLASGGGFLARPGNRYQALANAVVVYLETSSRTATSRVMGNSGRPLLQGVNPAAAMTRLLARREAFYLQSHQRVSTNGRSAYEVAGLVAELARAVAGW